jgi:hypothetical protein
LALEILHLLVEGMLGLEPVVVQVLVAVLVLGPE